MLKNLYLIYISYDDDSRNIKNKRFNTEIIGLYDNKNVAINELEKIKDDITLDFSNNGDWFYKELEKELEKDEKKIKVYQMFNDEIENYDEMFYIILEKIEIKKED